MTLEIYELGARRKSAQFLVDDSADPDLVAWEIYIAACKMKALASRNIGATWDPNTNAGTVVAGIRVVGKVRRLK